MCLSVYIYVCVCVHVCACVYKLTKNTTSYYIEVYILCKQRYFSDSAYVTIIRYTPATT